MDSNMQGDSEGLLQVASSPHGLPFVDHGDYEVNFKALYHLKRKIIQEKMHHDYKKEKTLIKAV